MCKLLQAMLKPLVVGLQGVCERLELRVDVFVGRRAGGEEGEEEGEGRARHRGYSF